MHISTIIAMAEPTSTNMAEGLEARVPSEPQLETESMDMAGKQSEQTTIIPPFESQTRGVIPDEQTEQSDMYMSGATVNSPFTSFTDSTTVTVWNQS